MNALANFFTRLVNRYMPDSPASSSLSLLTMLTMLLAVLMQGTSPLNADALLGRWFLGLATCSMQMTVILLTRAIYPGQNALG